MKFLTLFNQIFDLPLLELQHVLKPFDLFDNTIDEVLVQGLVSCLFKTIDSENGAGNLKG